MEEFPLLLTSKRSMNHALSEVPSGDRLRSHIGSRGNVMSYQFAFNKLDMILFHATLWEAWMRSLIVGDKPTVARLAERLKQARSRASTSGFSACSSGRRSVARRRGLQQLLGWATATVHVLHSRWSREGDAIFDLRDRGGRRHQHLSVEQEQALLAPFAERAEGGGMLTVAEIQRAYEEHTGVQVAPSTVYRLLDRHGWRKVVPRPRHPKADVAAQAAFKKTGTARYAKRSLARLSKAARCG